MKNNNLKPPTYSEAMQVAFDWIAYAIETGNDDLAYHYMIFLIKTLRHQVGKGNDPTW